MSRKRTIACALAALIAALPLAACRQPVTAESPEEVIPMPEPAPEIPTQPAPMPEPEPELTPMPANRAYVLVKANGLNVRSGAGTQYASMGAVDRGDMLRFVSRADGWYETYYRGKRAYVSANAAYTAPAALPVAGEEAERVIAEGEKLLGVPYVYGAVRLHDGRGHFLKNFTTSAFDCSSLMQYIFYRGAGILLDVTTRTQVKQGEAVAWKDIRRGDLLFFTNASRYHKTGVERIGHVALYLGENYILHTASDYAVIEEMSAQRRAYFITARRFF